MRGGGELGNLRVPLDKHFCPTSRRSCSLLSCSRMSSDTPALSDNPTYTDKAPSEPCLPPATEGATGGGTGSREWIQPWLMSSSCLLPEARFTATDPDAFQPNPFSPPHLSSKAGTEAGAANWEDAGDRSAFWSWLVEELC